MFDRKYSVKRLVEVNMAPIAAAQFSWQEFFRHWLVADVIALIALVQPYIYWGWKRYFRKGRIDVHETAKVEVGYSTYGSTIAVLGTLRAVHEDQFVRSIELVLTRIRDNMQRRFEWLAFRPATIVLAGPAEVKLEVASGFMLLTSEPWKYHIVFLDPQLQTEITSVLDRVRNAWIKFLDENGGMLPGANLNDLFQQFRVTMDHVNTFADLDRLLDWQPVEYSINVRVNTANPNRTFTRQLRFSVALTDVEVLRLNRFKIIEEACGIQTTLVYNFGYCKYMEQK